MITSPCGKTKSRNGNPFTLDSLADHVRNCPDLSCKTSHEANKEFNYDPFCILDDDMPDGAYFAMHQEIYGW